MSVEYKKIKDLFHIEKGTLQSSKNTPGGYNFITASSEWKTHDRFTHDGEAVVIAVAASGSLGRVHYVSGKFIASDLCFILTPKDPNGLNVDLLFYAHVFKMVKRDLIEKTSTGTSKLAINKTNFGDYEVPYFTFDEQVKLKSILAAISDAEDALGNEIEKRRILFRALRYSLLNGLISGASKHEVLRNLCDFVKGETPIMKATPGDFPLVTTGPVRGSSNTFQFDSEAVCIPLVSSAGHGKKTLNYVHYQVGKFALGTILVALIPKRKEILNVRFLHEYLSQNKDELLVSLMKGAANVSLPIKAIQEIKIPLPSSKEQEIFARAIEKINLLDRQSSVEEKDIDLLTSTFFRNFIKKSSSSITTEKVLEVIK